MEQGEQREGGHRNMDCDNQWWRQCMGGWRVGHWAQPLLSLEFCPDLIYWHHNWGFPCTPSRSPCHCPETWFLKLSLVVAFLPPWIWHCQTWWNTFPPDDCAWPCFVLTFPSFPFSPDEQQEVEQLPAGHPAGEQEAVQQGPAGGDGAEPVAAAHPARGLRDPPTGDRPQVVLRQLHLLPPALVHHHHHHCRGKCPPWEPPTLPQPHWDTVRGGEGLLQTWPGTDVELVAVGIACWGVLSGDCDPVIGTVCMWHYTVWETRAKLRSENRTVLERWVSQWN